MVVVAEVAADPMEYQLAQVVPEVAEPAAPTQAILVVLQLPQEQTDLVAAEVVVIIAEHKPLADQAQLLWPMPVHIKLAQAEQ
jgi:hypothetical protein